MAKATKERREAQGFLVPAGIDAPSALGPGCGHPVGTLSHTTGSGRLSGESSRGQYHARHVEALREALVALVGPSKAKAALKQATAWALPDGPAPV